MKVFKPEYVKGLRQLTDNPRNELVISIASVGHILSRYGDIIWDFSPYIHLKGSTQYEKKINFSTIRFDDGSYLTDPQHSPLLSGVKAFLYVRLTVNSPCSGQSLSESSIIGLRRGFLPSLLRWMVATGHRRFADLTAEACMSYVAHTREATANENCYGGRKNVRLSAETKYYRFAHLEDLWTFREHLPDALTEHPWPGQSAGSLAGVLKGGRDTSTEQIPDRLMVKLVQKTLRFVTDGYGERLLACRDARDEGYPIDSHLAQLGIRNWRAVKSEITKLLMACYVVIAAFSGMRISEVLSLETSCYYEHEGWDGAIYGWLKGITYKLEEDPKSVEWMVPPVVEQAVKLATRTTVPLRCELENRIVALETKLQDVRYLDDAMRLKDVDALHEMKRHRLGLFLGNPDFSSRITTLSGIHMSTRLRNVAKDCDLKVESADMDQIRDKSKISVGMIWPLATHQFRKTFARYVSRCILGDVRYLREHFKHWSLDMTLSYAWNEDDLLDPTLIDEVLEEHQNVQSDIVFGWIDFNRNQHLAGVGGKNIESGRDRDRVLIATDPRAAARQLSKGYFLRGLGHSWCTEKECQGKGIYSVTVCKDCENRVIDQSHIPIWHGIRQQQIELLHTDDCGDPMWQGATDSLRYAEHVLGDLGEEIEPYSVPSKPSERRSRA